MDKLIALINEPWPWYISGPFIGLTIPLLLHLGNKSFGISSFFRNAIAYCGLFKKTDYFNFNVKNETWNILFVLGVLLSGFIGFQVFDIQQGELSLSAKQYLFDKEIAVESIFPTAYFSSGLLSFKSVLLAVGGLLIGFGSRYAKGCTSGHAITGLSQLSLSSLIAVVGFFIGGLFATYLIIDNIL